MSGCRESLMSEGVPNVSPIILTELKKQDQTNEVPYGYCHCGCGHKTELCKKTYKRLKGHILGQPRFFITGHAIRGENNPAWNGGREIDKSGYVLILLPSNLNSSERGYVREHILICEKVLGKNLPEGAVIHHVDKNTGNNKNSNLVICQDNTYHLYLHQRLRAYKACGIASWLKCSYCGKYDDPNNLVIRIYNNHQNNYHRKCSNENQRNRKLKRKNIIKERDNHENYRTEN